MSETEKMEDPTVYDTLTSIANATNDQTTSDATPVSDNATTPAHDNDTSNTTSAPAPVYDTLAPLQTNQDTTVTATTTAPRARISSEIPFISIWDQVYHCAFK